VFKFGRFAAGFCKVQIIPMARHPTATEIFEVKRRWVTLRTQVNTDMSASILDSGHRADAGDRKTLERLRGLIDN
jgi:hypothetical protein